MKVVAKLDKKGNVIEYYSSCIKAAHANYVGISSVSSCCTGARKSVYGMYFKYVSDKDVEILLNRTINMKKR